MLNKLNNHKPMNKKKNNLFNLRDRRNSRTRKPATENPIFKSTIKQRKKESEISLHVNKKIGSNNKRRNSIKKESNPL